MSKDLKKIQEIFFDATREASKHVDQDIVGFSELLIGLSLQFAVIATEFAGVGETLRKPGGKDKTIKYMLNTIEQLVSEEIDKYLEHESKQPRQ